VDHCRYDKGITLIELLVVIVIIGILAAVAVPVYTGYMQRARRADAKTALEQIRAAQEMYRAEKGKYALQIQNTLDKYGVSLVSGYYNLSFTVALPNSFTARAEATGTQAADGNLFINHLGQKWDSDNKYYPNSYSKWSK
jgi:type IV pilus assembly protein PilE